MMDCNIDKANANMPAYIEDILVNNYCPNFLRMSMVKERDDYRFSYKTDRYRRINCEMLNTRNKLVLLRSIMCIHDRNEEWLIKAERYKLELELIYSINNSVEDSSLRLLYYPDNEGLPYVAKLTHLAEELVDSRDKRETEIFKGFAEIVAGGDWNRVRMFLDKHIIRLDSQSMTRVS